ncbi:hypothetical protein WR164_04260 [Philodulcilactobacillus myokoensis]|uniref:Aggregation promoting factor surface protein n=1 Tax=Philodulcilactobacillus myokoensis TaxID=2929573 RepID=A0A9W6ESF6_9LACO|nr:aggregation promoting factor surface protein [Philodulcilactobacillus myokoensis]GLB46447.1 hypothetical protein WR164_04260 [Philodulcilactobacillus myokoensis]
MKLRKAFVMTFGIILALGIGMIANNHVQASASTKNITIKHSRHFVINKKNKHFLHSHDADASLSKNDRSAKKWIAWNESKDHYRAHNGIYYGKYQLGISLLHGDYSPDNQEACANKYVKSRYGTWSNAKRHWLRYNWY